MSSSDSERWGKPRGDTLPDAPQQEAVAAYRLPATVSADALLDATPDGASDARFRQMITDLLHLEVEMREARDRLGAIIGLTGPAYSILMTIARGEEHGGLRVRQVAAKLHVTGAYITSEVNKLVEAGLVEKHPDPDDRRGVILRLSLSGIEQMDILAPQVRAVNDYFFGGLGRVEFELLSRVAARLGTRSAAAFFNAFRPAA